MIRILLADDHALVRRGVRLILEQQPDIEVVAEAADGAEAVALLREVEVDLVILDIHLPQMSGDTLAIALLRRWPKLIGRVLLMSGDPWALRADWPEELRRCPLLVKPFTLDGLAAQVRATLTAPAPQAQRKRNGG